MRPYPPQTVPWLGIALISCSALAYEVLLTRLLAIVHWHHFAAMVISLAMLGYGASGTALFLLRGPAGRRVPEVFTGAALVFAVAGPLCFYTVQAMPFDPSELPWDWRLSWRLAAVYLLLALPFFAAATCVGVGLMGFPEASHRVYAFDLLGAGAGALLVVVALFLLPVEHALLAVAATGLAGAAAGAWQMGLRRRGGLALGCLLGVSLLPTLPASWTRVHPADYKDLSQALAVMGARVVEERSSPLGRLTLLENEQVPFRFAPGLSLSAGHRPPPQLALYVDGVGAGAVPAGTPPAQDLAYLDGLTSALPYHLLEAPRVLLVGLGGGEGVLQALHLGAATVTVSELDPLRTDLVRRHGGRVFSDPRVGIRLGDTRAMLAREGAVYDLIRMDLLQGGGTGLDAQSAGYLTTREAVAAYLARLGPGGLLAFDQWLRLPPRQGLKLVATVLEALRGSGEAQPQRRIALVRGWKTTTFLVGEGYLAPHQIAALRAFCRDRAFDPVYFQGIAADELNRHNRLKAPLLYEGVTALLGPGAQRFMETYPFDLRPTTDDRPYFDDSSRWRALPELLRMPARGGLAHMDWGYWLQVASLVQATLIGALLICAPLLAVPRRGRPGLPAISHYRGRMLLFFLALGGAFMLVEVAFIQKLQLLLGHPVYAVAATLAGFLVFAGLGSAASRRLLEGRRRPVWGLVVCLGLVAGLELGLLGGLLPRAMALPMPAKLTVSLALIAPLAFCMGMPFPWGMRRLGREAREMIPWAWGVNGFASVVSAILAGILAMAIGFSGLVGAGLLAYMGAALVVPRST